LLIPFSRQWIVAYILKNVIKKGAFYAASSASYTQQGDIRRSQTSQDVIEGEFISHDDKP